MLTGSRNIYTSETKSSSIPLDGENAASLKKSEQKLRSHKLIGTKLKATLVELTFRSFYSFLAFLLEVQAAEDIARRKGALEREIEKERNKKEREREANG